MLEKGDHSYRSGAQHKVLQQYHDAGFRCGLGSRVVTPTPAVTPGRSQDLAILPAERCGRFTVAGEAAAWDGACSAEGLTELVRAGNQRRGEAPGGCLPPVEPERQAPQAGGRPGPTALAKTAQLLMYGPKKL